MSTSLVNPVPELEVFPPFEQLSGPHQSTVVPEERQNILVGVRGSQVKVSPGGRKILVAYERSDDGDCALAFALETAKPADHVFLCSVLPFTLVEHTLSFGVPYIDPKSELKYLELMADSLGACLHEKAHLFIDKGINVTIHICYGEPRRAILALASFHHVSDIIVGRRKLGKSVCDKLKDEAHVLNHVDTTRFQRFISIGSVSQYIVAHAEVNVIVAKA